jgi:hypothetical protein
LRIVFGDLIAPSNTEVHATLANKGRDIGGGKEDECDRQVLDEGDV